MPGYRGRNYYGGCEFVDEVEVLAIERPKKLFNCNFANVQPHSGFQANQTLILVLVKLGEKILRISLVAGGHFSGSRIGSPAGTTRGFKETEFKKLVI